MFNKDKVAKAASFPLFFFFVFDLSSACFLFKHVNIPLPIGFLYWIDKFIIPSVADFEINSKCGVFPFITHPRAIMPSDFSISCADTTGISKIPGTLTIL